MTIWNFGIIGTGLIADIHAQAIQSLGNANLAGVCSSDPANANTFAKKYNCKAFANYAEMLESSEIAIVTIATPSGNHLESMCYARNQWKYRLNG
jgi:UDP-N-acetyl-2-amino-2-deoxyglucuronate dehydrogenase